MSSHPPSRHPYTFPPTSIHYDLGLVEAAQEKLNQGLGLGESRQGLPGGVAKIANSIKEVVGADLATGAIQGATQGPTEDQTAQRDSGRLPIVRITQRDLYIGNPDGVVFRFPHGRKILCDGGAWMLIESDPLNPPVYKFCQNISTAFDMFCLDIIEKTTAMWVLSPGNSRVSLSSPWNVWQEKSPLAIHLQQVLQRILTGIFYALHPVFNTSEIIEPRNLKVPERHEGYVYTNWHFISNLILEVMKSLSAEWVVKDSILSDGYRSQLQDIFKTSSQITGYLGHLQKHEGQIDWPAKIPPDLILYMMESAPFLIPSLCRPTTNPERKIKCLKKGHVAILPSQVGKVIIAWMCHLSVISLEDLPEHLQNYLAVLPPKVYNATFKYCRELIEVERATEQAKQAEVQVAPAEPEAKDLTPAEAAPEVAPPAEAEHTTEAAEVQVAPTESAPEPICAETTVIPKLNSEQQAQFLSTLGIHSLLQQQCRQLESQLNQLSPQGDECQTENNPAQPAVDGLEQITKDRFAALPPEEAQQALERLEQINQELLARFSQLTCQLHKLKTVS